MPARRTRGTVSNPHRVGLVALALALTASAALAGSTRGARESERISVTAVSGAVSVTMAGSATQVQPNSTVSLPARIVTGDDGVLGLTQAGTNITIASDSDIEIPAEAAGGQLIARLVQRRGNVFYDVAHRDVGTLRVETPFLVAVIKGTQFNVAAQADGTTISLFQGRLEIRTPDASDIIQLNAGEIAIRGNADNSIRVLSMNERRVDAPRAGEPVVARTAPGGDTDAHGVRADIVPVAEGTRVGSTAAARAVVAVQAGLAPASSTDGAGVALPAEPPVAIAGTPAMHVDSGIGLGADVGHAGPSVGAAIDLGAGTALGTVSVGSSAALGAAGANISVGAGAAIGGAGASLGASLNVSAVGNPSVSLGASTSLGAGSPGPSLGANVDVGTAGPGVSLGANASVGAANLGATVSVGGASTGLLGTGLNVGLDLGNTGAAATPPATPPAAIPATPAVVLPALGAVTLPTLPILPAVTTPATPAPTTPGPAQPAPPVLGVIGKLLGHP